METQRKIICRKCGMEIKTDGDNCIMLFQLESKRYKPNDIGSGLIDYPEPYVECYKIY